MLRLSCALLVLACAVPSCGGRSALELLDVAQTRGGSASGAGGTSSATGGISSSAGAAMGATGGRPGMGGGAATSGSGGATGGFGVGGSAGRLGSGGVAGSSARGGAAGSAGSGGDTGGGGPGGAAGSAGAAGSGEVGGAGGAAGAGGEAGSAPLVTDLALGAFHTCAAYDDGALRCWGSAGYIGSGNGVAIGDDELPEVAPDVNIGGKVRAIVASWYQTCALLETGSVRCFGNGADGKLGYGNVESIGDDEAPASAGDVDVGGKVSALGAGPYHTCACLETGKVRCWGSNVDYELGYPSINPVGDDESPASAGDVEVGGFAIQLALGFGHTCALLDGGTVRCWGKGTEGRLGYGNQETIGDDEPPSAAGDVDVGGKAVQIVAGMFHTCALLDSGKVRCWGRGSDGRLGYGNTETIGDDETPASAGDVDLGGRATALAAGDFATCALLEGGAVRCWGLGDQGELGHGNTETIGDDETPASAGDVEVGGPVTHIDMGFLHTCARLANGAVRCWGRGSTGALGYGNRSDVGDNEAPASAGDVKARPSLAP